MMPLYKRWCNSKRTSQKKKHLWLFVEKSGGRADITNDLSGTVLAHYHNLDQIAEDIQRLGYEATAEIVRARLPMRPKARSGDLGEILAAELVEEEMGFVVPVRRLRYKDDREMPLRGDDFIGAGYDDRDRLCLLKGEAKSRKRLSKTTVVEARKALNENQGRCTPASLLFVADRMMEQGGDFEALGRDIRDEVGTRSLPRGRMDHLLFAMSGNKPPSALREDLNNADSGREHTVIHLRIEDHQEFIAFIYDRVADIGIC